MQKIKIFIVEDEIILSESLHEMLDDLGYEVVGISITAEDGLEQILKLKPDLALLDINLRGEESGIWLGKKIQESIKIPFIYLTSFADKETIIEATATSPFGYLVKPVEKPSLYAGIEVALTKLAEQHSGSNIEKHLKETPLINNNYLFVKDEYQYKKVSIFDVFFVKASGNYIEIFTPNKRHVIKGSLKTFKDSLPNYHFFQTHRSYLVNLNKIDSFGTQSLIIDSQEIPISKALKSELKQTLKTYAFKSE